VAAHAEKVYYEIEGLSRAEISAALRAHGPDVRGQQFFGLTEWEMGVEYRAVEVESGCAIDGLKVRVSTETHLPRWPGDAVASSALSGAWDRFITALDHHEDGHRVLAEEAAETVRRRLLAVSAPTCGRLDGVAQREMAAVMQEYEARQLAYDAETDHGRTQGAVWPPARAEHLSASVGEE
jgi:predicted secreted Zn-dependent protease